MTRPILVAGNWKMNHSPQETRAFLQRFLTQELPEGIEVVICPPFTSLSVLYEAFQNLPAARRASLSIGAQNLHWADRGAYTGEVSPLFLKAWGVSYVIVGHSERRTLMGETDQQVARKVAAAFAHGMVPILCVGEDREERDRGQTEEKVLRQVQAGLEPLRPEQAGQMVVAYEPIWAIGSGRTPTPGEIGQVLGNIRRHVASRFGREVSERLRLLYGGSVDPENISSLIGEQEVDGVLVGGASLDPERFLQIIQRSKSSEKKG